MIEVGRVVVKIAGRDAGRTGVVIAVNGGRVLVDGQVRRREVSINHVEPTAQTVDVAENASFEAVRKALEPLGIEFTAPGAREHKPAPKPVKQRKSVKKAAAPRKKAKKTTEKKTLAKDKASSGKAEKKPAKKAPAKKRSAKKSA